MTMKFHEKAISIYGLKQNKEGNSAIKEFMSPVGTITVSNRAKAVFKAMTDNETLTIAGLTFTCTDSDGMTASEVAACWANLAEGSTASAANSANPSTKGNFSSGTLNGYFTTVLNPNTLFFSPATPALTPFTLTPSGTAASKPTVSYTLREVFGVGTGFLHSKVTSGMNALTTAGVVIGTISTISSDTHLTLTADPALAYDTISFLLSETSGKITISNRATIGFKAITQNQTVIFAGLTLTATHANGMTAAEIASAFKDLAVGTLGNAAVTQNSVTKGTITGTLTGYYTSAWPAGGGSIAVTPATESMANFTLTVSGTGSPPTIKYRKDVLIGVGTKFKFTTINGANDGDLTVGAYVYSSSGDIIARVSRIDSNTFALLESEELTTTAYTPTNFKVGLGPKNALAVLNLEYSSEFTTESYQYTGDELSRDEQTNITDKFAQATFETFVPKLGVLSEGDPTINDVPYPSYWEACGFAVILSTDGSGTVKFTNSVASNAYLTMEIRRSSPDDTSIQKVFTITDARGMLDFDGTVGTKGKLKWTFMGNLKNVVDKPRIDPNTTTQLKQTQNVASNIKSDSIVTTQLSVYTDVVPTYVANTKNVCFNKLSAPNMAGFNYGRYLTGCGDGWSKGAIATDVTLTILEREAGAEYNPDDNVEKNHALFVRYASNPSNGSGAVQLNFNKIQLTKPTNSKVAEYAGQDLAFRNIGTTDIILTGTT